MEDRRYGKFWGLTRSRVSPVSRVRLGEVLHLRGRCPTGSRSDRCKGGNQRGPFATMSSHPSPATLDSLVQYTDIQKERIESLLESGFRPLEEYDPMITLWRDVWGKSELCLDATEKIKRDVNKVDDSLINGVVPNEFNVMVLPPAVDRCWEIISKRGGSLFSSLSRVKDG